MSSNLKKTFTMKDI